MKRLSAYMIAKGAIYVVLVLALGMSQYRQGALFTSFPSSANQKGLSIKFDGTGTQIPRGLRLTFAAVANR